MITSCRPRCVVPSLALRVAASQAGSQEAELNKLDSGSVGAVPVAVSPPCSVRLSSVKRDTSLPLWLRIMFIYE